MNKKDVNYLLPAVALILVISVYLVCSKVFMPSIVENSAKISAADSDIAKASEKLDSLAAANKSMDKLSELVNSLLVAVPDSVNSPDLITEIEVIAAQNQVILATLNPPVQGNNTSGSKSGSMISVSVTGPFQGINSFINSIETTIRYSRISSVSIISGEEGLSATITFEVYSRPVVISTVPAATSATVTPENINAVVDDSTTGSSTATEDTTTNNAPQETP